MLIKTSSQPARSNISNENFKQYWDDLSARAVCGSLQKILRSSTSQSVPQRGDLAFTAVGAKGTIVLA
ncbi:hypothetical protein RRG08_057845 [Elysia crispata]|uniref:Uncharacterized protein n=1 Tax=Elysia crispata TaxID=231223 RepID=A0AAE1AZ87_9GAST|nr:hypothetical protein RRG08_057845 [Elysia crispata]